MNSSKSWWIRPYKEGDDERVVQLYRAVYGRPLSIDEYRWKLVDTPWSVGAPNVWLSDDGEKLVGHYAATPLRFKLGEEQLIIAHTGDAMTHPDFRKQGVFTGVALAAHESWAATGVPFLVGVPNDQWVSRRAPLGYREQFKLVWFWRPLRLDRLLSRRFRLPSFFYKLGALAIQKWRGMWDLSSKTNTNISVKAVNQPGPEFDTLWRRLKDHYPALYVRDRAWLSYRYAAAPGCDYRFLLAQQDKHPVGYLVYRLTSGEDRITGWILDIFTAPDDLEVQNALLQLAMEAIQDKGADTVRTLISAEIPLAKTLRSLGFRRARGEFDASLVVLDQPLPDLSSPYVWFTMTGDYDLV
jgi:hypothetical protein